ncbi:MAG: permease-like cell division protein FtsX [Patescibacteria group bacterium]
MKLISLYRICKTALVSLWRNRWLSLAATLIMVLTLITISFFVTLIFVTNQTTKTLKEKVDMSVYFEDTASKDQIFAIQNLLLSRTDIKSVEYVSKEKALELWRARNRDNDRIRDIISETDNPLPRSLEVKTGRPEDLGQINNLLNSADYKPLIKRISYEKNKDLINRLVRIANFTRIVGWTLSTVFMLIALLIIFNTIRLTIFARREEIEIMKLVGASDWYVRGPFILEGVSYGFVGAAVSAVFYFFIYRLVIPDIESYLGLTGISASYLGLSIYLIILMQFVIGFFLGASCSVAAIKKHLK